MNSLFFYIIFVLIIFLFGILGLVLNRKNVLIILMSIELMLLATNMYFCSSSIFLDDLVGQIFALFVLTIAASESAVGLAIFVAYHRVNGNIFIEKINMLRN
jgi:NADH-quinone oxidoreductase subunit K